MTIIERGVIRNRQLAQKIKDFSGLRFGKITPTDIDVFLDFGDQLFVIIENKSGTAPMPYGQRLAIQRLCDASESPTRRVVAIIARHPPNGDVDADTDCANALVSEFRWRRQWRHEFRKNVTVRYAIDTMLRKYTKGIL